MPYGHLRERGKKKKKKKDEFLDYFRQCGVGMTLLSRESLPISAQRIFSHFPSKQPILIEVVLGWKGRLCIEMDYILLSLNLYAFIPSWVQQRPWEREKVAQLCPTQPPHGGQPSVNGILQARILEWIAVSFSRGSSQLRHRIWVSHFAGTFFTLWEALVYDKS